MSCLMFDDEAVAGLIPEREIVSVTGNGVKTYGTLLSELYALVDMAKITPNSIFELQDDVDIFTCFQLYQKASSRLIFSAPLSYSGSSLVKTVVILPTGSVYSFTTLGGSYTDRSATQLNNGFTFKIYY